MNYKEYYAEQLNEACEYQDFVMENLYKIGLPLLIYSSQKKQHKGESMNGVEIKHDKRAKETGNLYIETAEKSHPDKPYFVRSGIYREDNTWLWAIGDYERIFILSKKQLQWAHKLKKYQEVITETSKGFLLPIADCEKFYAMKILEVKNEEETNSN